MAAAGSAGCCRGISGLRLQWLNFDGGYKTYYSSFDVYSRDLRSGIGIEQVRNDEGNGMITNDHFQFTISPAFSFGWLDSVTSQRQVVVKPAIGIGIVQYAFDWSKYTWGDQIDPIYGFLYTTNETKNKEKSIRPDFGGGIFTYGEKFYGGVYIHHLFQPPIGVLYSGIPLYARAVLNGGYLLKGDWLGKFELIPSFIFEEDHIYRNRNIKRIELTLTAKYDKFMLGISERYQSAFVCMAGFKYDFFKIGYAYDINTTDVRKAVGSTHELFLGFNFACRKEFKKIRTLDF